MACALLHVQQILRSLRNPLIKMGEQVKLLRKENQDLKKQLSEIQTNLISIQKEVNYEKQHGAGKKQRTWSHTPSLTIAQPDTKPNENDVQFLSNEYDELSKRLANLEAQVSEIARKTESISKAVDDIQLYSYQYNLKLVGVPQTDPDEKTSDTVDLCLKVFSGIGADVSASDIDIAHRVPTRNQNGRRRQASQLLSNPPIICKFTRRIIRDDVLSKRRNSNRLLPANFGLQSENDMRISIFSHLTPRLQELLYLAKSFKEQGSYKYCWAKDTAVFLRKSDSSRVIRLNTVQDLEQLRHSEAGGAASNQTASDSAQS